MEIPLTCVEKIAILALEPSFAPFAWLYTPNDAQLANSRPILLPFSSPALANGATRPTAGDLLMIDAS